MYFVFNSLNDYLAISLYTNCLDKKLLVFYVEYLFVNTDPDLVILLTENMCT